MRLLIEGCKYSGKSTLVQKLSNIHRNATKVEYRAFTQQGKTNNFAIHSDVEQRLIALSNFVVSTHDDDIFLLRGHLSVFALAETLNQSLGFSFYEIDKMFWEADILLVLLTINQDAYEERF